MHTLQFPCQRNPGSMSDICGKTFKRVFLPLLRIFSSSSGLCKVIKGPYLSLEKAQCKDKNLPRQHPPNRIFIDFKRYTDTHTLTFNLLEKCPNAELFTDQYGPVITLHLDTFHTVLWFLINIEKSYLVPILTLEFAGVIVDSRE